MKELTVLSITIIFLSLSLMVSDINHHKQIEKLKKENILLQIKCKGIK